MHVCFSQSAPTAHWSHYYDTFEAAAFGVVSLALREWDVETHEQTKAEMFEYTTLLHHI